MKKCYDQLMLGPTELSIHTYSTVDSHKTFRAGASVSSDSILTCSAVFARIVFTIIDI